MLQMRTQRSSLSGSHAHYFSSAHLTTITGAAIELFVKRTWYRNLARIRRACSASASHEAPTVHSSIAARLPLEVVGMIIAQLFCDMRSLSACSLTCYSWYIATIPHLHHTLSTPTSYSHWDGDGRFVWSKQLRNKHKLGLLPLVKKIHIRRRHYRFKRSALFSLTGFNHRILRHFSALTNVQELEIDSLDIPSFMPSIQRYFGHFLPSVRSLFLTQPRGSDRQIIYFIGLFQHLEDLGLYILGDVQDEPVDNQILVPPFAPPLGGSLTLTTCERVRIVKDMVDLFGGIRFRHMNLRAVNGTRLLLGACAKTLETLRLNPFDTGGGNFTDLRAGAN